MYGIGPLKCKPRKGRVMVFNTTFNIISAISWQSVLLVEESRTPRENHQRAECNRQTFHIMLYIVHLAMSRIQTHNFSGDTLWLHR